METIKFNNTFKVQVEVEKHEAEIGEVQRYLTDRCINWSMDFESGFPVFTYECDLCNATSIYLDIRSIGVTAISNDRMNKEFYKLTNPE